MLISVGVNTHVTRLWLRINFQFRFWSRWHRRVVMWHIYTKFYAHIFIQYEIQYGRHPLAWICLEKSWDHPRKPIHGGYAM